MWANALTRRVFRPRDCWFLSLGSMYLIKGSLKGSFKDTIRVL